MARRKRTSINPLEKARQVLAGFKQINPKPDLGTALSAEMYEAEINGYSHDLEAFNGELAAVDDTTNRLDVRRQGLHDLTQRIQAAVKGLYGPDSPEFELVGGLRRSNRKRPVRTIKTPAKA
jgi:hypothetical protein